MFKSRKKIFLKYSLVFASTFLFVFTVIFLRKYGYIKEFKLPEKIFETPKLKWQETNIKIKKQDISNKVIFTQDKKLFVYDLDKKSSTELISDQIVEYPGILEDGRIYFWSKQKDLYNQFYLQDGGSFNKLEIPLEEGDYGSQNSEVPLVSPDGTYLAFLSSRDTASNYQHNAVYIFDLNNFTLDKITDNNLMTVDHLFISGNSNLIGFTYSYLESQENDLSLGIIMDQTTPNLFSKIKVNNNKAYFSYDNKKVLLESSEGFQIFDLEKGKFREEIEDYNLDKVNSEIVILSQNLEKKSCDENEGFRNYLIYSFLAKDLDEIFSSEDKDYLLNIREINSVGTKALVNYQDQKACEEKFGIFDFENENFTPLENFNYQENIFFTP